MPVSEIDLDNFYSVLLNEKEALPPGDRLYVENLHFDAQRDVMEELAREIRLSQNAGYIAYFTGNRGTGKSTELLRLMQMLKAQGQTALYIDLTEYLIDGEPPDVKTLLVLLALAFAREADELFGTDLRKSSVLRRFWQYMNTTEVELEKLDVHAFKLKLSSGSGFQSRFMQETRNDGATWIEEARVAIAAVASAIKERTGRPGVSLLFDSFERIRAKSPSAEAEFYARIAEIFNSVNLLRFVGISVVYSVPPYLPVIANVQNQVNLRVLGSVRVFEKPTAQARRRPRREGLDKLRSVLDRRYARWSEVIAPTTLDLLAERSGGDLRLFLNQLVRSVVSGAYHALERLPIQPTDEIVLDLIATQENQMSSLLYLDHLPVLLRIVDEANVVVTDPKEQAAAARLFDERLLFNYANGVQWVDANPMIWTRIDRYRAERTAEKASAAVNETDTSASHMRGSS
jgi:energy-coupling factor transporter ATP-binding protein EcfA2